MSEMKSSSETVYGALESDISIEVMLGPTSKEHQGFIQVAPSPRAANTPISSLFFICRMPPQIGWHGSCSTVGPGNDDLSSVDIIFQRICLCDPSWNARIDLPNHDDWGKPSQ